MPRDVVISLLVLCVVFTCALSTPTTEPERIHRSPGENRQKRTFGFRLFPASDWTRYHQTWRFPSFTSMSGISVYENEDSVHESLRKRIASLEIGQRRIVAYLQKLTAEKDSGLCNDDRGTVDLDKPTINQSEGSTDPKPVANESNATGSQPADSSNESNPPSVNPDRGLETSKTNSSSNESIPPSVNSDRGSETSKTNSSSNDDVTPITSTTTSSIEPSTPSSIAKQPISEDLQPPPASSTIGPQVEIDVRQLKDAQSSTERPSTPQPSTSKADDDDDDEDGVKVELEEPSSELPVADVSVEANDVMRV